MNNTTLMNKKNKNILSNKFLIVNYKETLGMFNI